MFVTSTTAVFILWCLWRRVTTINKGGPKGGPGGPCHTLSQAHRGPCPAIPLARRRTTVPGVPNFRSFDFPDSISGGWRLASLRLRVWRSSGQRRAGDRNTPGAVRYSADAPSLPRRTSLRRPARQGCKQIKVAPLLLAGIFATW
jgi:hypothetical protein